MADPETIIRVENLGKKYVLAHRQAPQYNALRDVLANAGRRLAQRLRHPFRPANSGSSREEFWALRDVSFEVKRGEVVGIIGRNGAGKSTLLKILSRITEPTAGRATLHGRVASLLEVGTGFHPELTGRENVYLNGAILGMSRAEIRRKFDEIVAFAEVEKFLDTPVKRYSSGMYMRLAFAVAAHLEPEILVVDEVLAVGDAAFQKKCLGKMGQVSRTGRTVLFVSHNFAAINALCVRAILLSEGRLVMDDKTRTVTEHYSTYALVEEPARRWTELDTAPGNSDIRLLSVCVRPPSIGSVITIDTGSLLEVSFYNARPGINLDCTVYVVNSEGTVLFESGCIVSSQEDSRIGCYTVVGRIPPNLLNSGRYTLNTLFGKDQQHVLFSLEGVVSFEVENTATGRGLNMARAPGVVRPSIEWTYKYNALPATNCNTPEAFV